MGDFKADHPLMGGGLSVSLVEHYSGSLTGTTTSVDIALTTPVASLEAAYVSLLGTSANIASGGSHSACIMLELINVNTVRATRLGSDYGATFDFSVTHVSGAKSLKTYSGVSGTSQAFNATIDSVDMAKAQIIWQGSHTLANTNIAAKYTHTLKITSDTNVLVSRDGGFAGATYIFTILEF